jgi:small subunit ribosomal protein S6
MMLILPAEADEKVIGGVTDRISQVLGTGGGRITNVDRWGRRRFAFPINKITEGFYAVVEFDTEPAALKELERVLSLADDVIRFKVVVRPEHAKSSARAVPEPERETVPEAGPAAEGQEPQPIVEAAPTETEPEAAEPAEQAESESVPNAGAL